MLGDFPFFTQRPGIVNLLFSSEVTLSWNILSLSERENALNSVLFMKRIQMTDLCSSPSNSLTLLSLKSGGMEGYLAIEKFKFFPRLLLWTTMDCDFTFTTLSFFSWAYLSAPLFSICSTQNIVHIHWSTFACLVNLTVGLPCSSAQCQSLWEHADRTSTYSNFPAKNPTNRSI